MLQDNLRLFDQITARQRDIYKRKNIDYGDSFAESLDDYGEIAFIVRAGDKMNRLKQLGQASIKAECDESFIDTVSDLANYCVMCLMWLESCREEEGDHPCKS